MGLISRVSSRTYRAINTIKKMAILSKPVLITGTAVATVAWAFWYDSYRRSKPDYKKKLVEKRRNEIIKKREDADPFSYIKTIKLCENCMDRGAIAQYTMEQTGKGEVFLDQGDNQKGAAHIAMGMAYMEQAQIQMVLQSLQMQMPQGIIRLIMQFLRVAKSRTNSQMMEQMFSKQGESKAVGDAPVVSGKKEEPQDVDSIDGDSEEKIIEIEDDDAKSDGKTLDDALEIEEVEETQQLIEDEISDDEETEAPQPSGTTMQDSQFSVIEPIEEVTEPETLEEVQVTDVAIPEEVQPAEQVELPMTDRSVVPESNQELLVEEEQIQEISASNIIEENTIVVEEASQPEQIEEE